MELRLERDSWSMVKSLQATNKYAPPLPPQKRTERTMLEVSLLGVGTVLRLERDSRLIIK